MTDYNKQKYLNNKEYYDNNAKNWVLNNKEKRKKYLQSESYKKSNRITNWKRKGLIGDYQQIYQRYIDTNNCDDCNIILTYDKKMTSTTKCMDHDHITGEFRNILCNKCNNGKRLLNKNNKSGHKNISWDKQHNKWRYTGKGKKKRFRSKIDCLCWKFICILYDKKI